MVKFLPLLIGLMLGGLFAFALITGGIMLAENNNPSQSIGNDPVLSNFSSNIENALGESTSTSDTAEESLGASPVTLNENSIFFDALGGLWKSLKAIPVTIYNLTMRLIFTKIFGSQAGAIIFGVIGGIISMIIIFGVWKMIKTGDAG